MKCLYVLVDTSQLPRRLGAEQATAKVGRGEYYVFVFFFVFFVQSQIVGEPEHWLGDNQHQPLPDKAFKARQHSFCTKETELLKDTVDCDMQV